MTMEYDTDSSLEEIGTADGQQPALSQKTGPTSSPRRSNRRLLLWIGIGLLILVIGLLIIRLTTHQPPAKTTTTVNVNTQSLSPGTLQKLEQQNAGSVITQQLTIAPSTLFKNDLKVQGQTSLAQNLQIAKNLTVDGSANVAGDVSVSGLISATAISVSSLNLKTLQLGGDLNFGGHITPTGSRPTIAPNVAATGGTATVDGTDTSGTLSITTGSGTQIAGELAILTFSKAFATNPRVQLTPVGASSAALQAYVSQGVRFFTIETGNTPSASVTYVFNYFVTQ